MAVVSVVMCCYNSEQYIKKAIDSVLGQTYEDFEFIIWNDGSVDSTEEIVKSYNDERIKYFFHENTGIGIARSLALKQARGQYIAIIDSDDICLSNRLESEVAFLEKHQDYVVVSSQMILINESDEEIGYSYSFLYDKVIRKKMHAASVMSHSGCMYRKSIYDKAGGYSGIVLGEDHVLFSRMMKYGKAYNLPDPLVKYRIRNMSMMHSVISNAYLPILNEFRLKFIDDVKISDEDVVIYNRLYSMSKRPIKDTQMASFASCKNKSIEDSLLDCLKPILGERFSKRIIVYIKSLLFLFIIR